MLILFIFINVPFNLMWCKVDCKYSQASHIMVDVPVSL